MKYMWIYRDIMDREKVRAARELVKLQSKHRILGEWKAILGAFLYGDKPGDFVAEHLQKDYRIHLSAKDYEIFMEKVNLNSPQKRSYILGEMKSVAQILKKALDGDTEAVKNFADFTAVMAEQDPHSRRLFFKAKYLIVYLTAVDDTFKNPKDQVIMESYGERYCEHIFRELHKRLFEAMNVRCTRKSTSEVLKMTEQVFRQADSQSGNTELERLRFMNENYKNSLQLLQSMLDELKETVQTEAVAAKAEAVSEFFGQMNSETYGKLLDSVLIVDEILSKARSQGAVIEPRFMPLTIIFMQLSRFIKDFGIKAVEQKGRRFEVFYEDIENMSYLGDPFEADDDIRTVEVVSPGWRYKDVVISQPVVRQIEEDAD